MFLSAKNGHNKTSKARYKKIISERQLTIELFKADTNLYIIYFSFIICKIVIINSEEAKNLS